MMNDIISNSEKYFSEKRQCLVDFYGGAIKALERKIKINESPLSTNIYKRLLDELKQDFDGKIKVLDSLPHDMTKGVPIRYYVELNAQLESRPLYRAILIDYIECDAILSHLKESLALDEFKEKAGEEVLYKVIQIKKKITILFDTIVNNSPAIQRYFYCSTRTQDVTSR